MAQKIPDGLKNLLGAQKLGYVATVSGDNTPNLSPKGTIIGWGDTALAFADIRSPKTIQNLEKNANLEINLVDPLLRRGFRISGEGTILREGNTFEAIFKHYRKNGIKSPINAIVLVSIKKITEVKSPLYDLGISEAEIKKKWKQYFSEL